MTAKYFAILTHQGAAKMANATALGTKLNLTHLAVGDGGGTLPTPDPAQTALLGETRRGAINLLTIDPANAGQIIAEQIIPENEGGWWIREVGLFDSDGDLIAIANCPETYKPQLQEGSGRTQTIRMVLIVSSTEAVTLKIDPAVVLATREYVDSKDDAAAKKAANLSDLTNKTDARGNLGLGTAATKDVGVEAGQVMAVGAFGLGAGFRPRADAYCNQGEIFRVNSASKNAPGSGVYGVLSLPCDGGPSTGYIAVSNGGAGFLGRSAASGGVQWSRVYSTDNPPAASEVGAITRTDSPVGVPLPWPTQSIPAGWLKCNGAAFDKGRYPLLAQAYPSGRLPDLRGEFIRGFDDGRSADSGRTLLSAQAATLLRTGAMEYYGADGTGDDGAVGMGFANEDALQTTMPHGAKTPTGTLQPASGKLNDNAMIGKTNTKWVAEGSRWIALRPRNIAFNYIVRAA
ncbi:phage tail protein [Serratia sp. NPDC078593]|uniref:phage tail-collar fiber domain-containing protein n=1 Tax=unclassified Serratia (in: enterobacteria) TaxID=2647522 RepID=UPI0037D1835A